MTSISWFKLDVKSTCMYLTWKEQPCLKGTDFFALILTPWETIRIIQRQENTRTRPAVPQLQTAMTQLPVLEEESEQKHLGVIFLNLERNYYKFIASLWGECDVYDSRSDLIRWILRNLSAPSAKWRGSKCSERRLPGSCEHMIMCIFTSSPYNTNHYLGIVLFDGTQRRKRTCDLTSD